MSSNIRTLMVRRNNNNNVSVEEVDESEIPFIDFDDGRIEIMSTSNNFTSEDALTGNFASLNDAASHYQNVTMSCVYDVTDLSNNKCKFLYQCSDGFILASDSNSNYTYFTFQRLADT